MSPAPDTDDRWRGSEGHFLVLHGEAHRLLLQFIRRELENGGRPACASGGGFVSWSPTDRSRRVEPSVFVRLGAPRHLVPIWKTWERGVPELALDLISHRRVDQIPFSERLKLYGELGIRELVAFDAAAGVGHRIRAWDRVGGDLVERKVIGEVTPCVTLSAELIVAPMERIPAALRLRDRPGSRPWPTLDESKGVDFYTSERNFIALCQEDIERNMDLYARNTLYGK